MATIARPASRRRPVAMVFNRPISAVHKDASNPRKSDPARMGLLRLSLRKLGFIQPLFVTEGGMLLSGHQRTTVAGELGYTMVPTITASLTEEQIRGVNIVFNRATNDFNAFDTGSKVADRLDLEEVIAAAEALPDFEGDNYYALNCAETAIAKYTEGVANLYDKKATKLAMVPLRMGIRIPIVVSESGKVVNGIHRMFAALEAGETRWPVITIPDNVAEVALNFLNYLSMDYHVDGDFQKLLRASAYRRPQNNRGAVPKAMRFWANGHRTLPDKDSYSQAYWMNFRDIHGHNILDFGAGLGKAAPYLQTKGINAIDFEPYRIDPDADNGIPSPAYSREQARRFLNTISNPSARLDSIFLCSVLNSVPFLRDRMCVLAIVHALSSKDTKVYGTLRDISDFNYEYGGIRNANYFVFDSEPGVRLGDFMGNPKIQKFHTEDEARAMFTQLWKEVEFWPGGNVFYYKLGAPKGVNTKVLTEALRFEFGDLPFKDGSTMNLFEEAKKAFGARLQTTL